MSKRWLRVGSVFAACLLSTLAALAAPVDRAAYVYDSLDFGGNAAPRVIFERELAFEARIEALAAHESVGSGDQPYAERFVRAALERHVVTDLLANLPLERTSQLTPHPCDVAPSGQSGEMDLQRRVRLAQVLLYNRVGGQAALRAAAEQEGIGEDEITRLVLREANAARYLDRMVAPMLSPTDGELREVYRATPASRGRDFEEVRCDLRKVVLTQRFGSALHAFLQSARSRIRGRWVAR